jgi:rhodanese-related sulfurtransferase
MMRTTRLSSTMLLMIGLLVVSGCGQSKFAQEVDKEKSAVKLAREMAQGGYALITTAELKTLVDGEADMVLVDAMPYDDSYKKGHIPGARQFLFPIPAMEEWDVEQTSGKTKEQYAELLGSDKDRLIVTYCGFVACTRSHNAAFWAKKLGYTRVKRHPGGLFAWKGAGHPLDVVE